MFNQSPFYSINHFIFCQNPAGDEKSSQLLLLLADEQKKVAKPKRLKACSKIIKVIIIAGNPYHGH